MSLIDEALKRARMEAAQKAAEGEGLPYPTIPRHLGPRRRAGWLVPLVVALAVIAGVIVGLLLASRGGSPPVHTAELGAAPTAAAPLPVPAAAAAEQRATVRAEQPAVAEAQPPAAIPPGPGPEMSENTGTAAELEPVASEAAPPVTAPPTPATSPSPTPPTADPEPVAAIAAQPPAARQPAAAPAALPATPTADTEPSPSGATTVTDPDSGVLLVLPERNPPAATESATPPPSEVSTETYAQQYPLPGGGAIELGGIAWSETGPFALINGRVVGPGSMIESYTLERIRPGHVVLTGEGRRIHLSLQ